jgi:hypothetical protein
MKPQSWIAKAQAKLAERSETQDLKRKSKVKGARAQA